MDRDPFTAIADTTRRQIISYLKDSPLCMNELAKKFPALSRPAVSKQVKYLEECGLIRMHQSGRERFCILQLQALVVVSNWLKVYEEFWNVKMDKLGRYLNNS